MRKGRKKMHMYTSKGRRRDEPVAELAKEREEKRERESRVQKAGEAEGFGSSL